MKRTPSSDQSSIVSSRRSVFGMLGGLLVAFAIAACSPAPPLAEEQYRGALVGHWMGSVGEMKETISFRADGTYDAKVRPMGFISNTLGQGTTGTISGTWVIQGKVVTLTVAKAENEAVLNKSTTSTIESFTKNELRVKSASGEVSTFIRAN